MKLLPVAVWLTPSPSIHAILMTCSVAWLMLVSNLVPVATERGWQIGTAEAGAPRNRPVLEEATRQVEQEIEAAAAEALDSRAHAMPSGDDVATGVYARPCR